MPILKRRLFLILAAMILFGCPPLPAQALSNCGLNCSCSISATSIALSGYNPIANTPVTGTGTITVSCSLLISLGAVLVPYTISLSKGQSNSYTARQMSGPSSTMLNYNLYSDMGMATVWGDGTGVSQLLNNSLTVSVLNLLVPQIQTVYAQIPAGQNLVPLGTYADSVTATLQF